MGVSRPEADPPDTSGQIAHEAGPKKEAGVNELTELESKPSKQLPTETEPELPEAAQLERWNSAEPNQEPLPQSADTKLSRPSEACEGDVEAAHSSAGPEQAMVQPIPGSAAWQLGSTTRGG